MAFAGVAAVLAAGSCAVHGHALAQPAIAPAAEAATASNTEWLVDEATGRRYRLERLPKRTGSYRWLDEERTRIQVHYGLQLEVVRHDDEWFWVKVWESIKRAPQPVGRSPGETEAAKARVAAAYTVGFETADTLTLEPFDHGLPRTGQWRQGFDLADMNGDGHVDILFGPPRKSAGPRPRIFLGDGKGGWALWSEARYPSLPYDYGDAAAGDINGDGKADLVLGIHLRGLVALVGDGEGGFQAWSDGMELAAAGHGAVFSSRSVKVTDWNGDGRPDIVALGEGPQLFGPGGPGAGGAPVANARGLRVFDNRGDGTWGSRVLGSGTFLEQLFGDHFALGDLDRDGRTDFVIASRILSNRSILGFGSADDRWVPREVKSLPPHAVVTALALADLDGDDRPELLLAYQNRDADGVARTGIDIFSSPDARAWRRRPLAVVEGRVAFLAMATGDLDGDGRVDLAASTGEGEVWLFLGDGQGFFRRELAAELPAPVGGCRGYAVRLADADGDGASELFLALAGEASDTARLFDPSARQDGCANEGALRAWKARARPRAENGQAELESSRPEPGT